MQIACVLITHFPAKSEMYRYPKLETERFVIVDRNKSGSHVIDYSSRIKHRIRKNMTMQEAIITKNIPTFLKIYFLSLIILNLLILG